MSKSEILPQKQTPPLLSYLERSINKILVVYLLVGLLFSLILHSKVYSEYTTTAPIRIEWNGFLNNGWSDNKEAECLEHPTYGSSGSFEVIYCDTGATSMCEFVYRDGCNGDATGINARVICPIGYVQNYLLESRSYNCISICDSTEYYNIETEECSECIIDEHCKDELTCNGQELCIDGICHAVPDLNCEDERICAITECIEPTGCHVSFDNRLCECASEVPLPIELALRSSFPPQPITTRCSIFGGQNKLTTNVAVNYSLEEPSCHNECQSSLNSSLELNASLELCGIPLHSRAYGSFSLDRQGCVECNTSSCKEECSDGTCDTKTISGSLELNASRFFGSAVEAKVDDYGLSGKCGASIDLNALVAVQKVTVEDSGFICGECESCEIQNINAQISAEASADCVISIQAGEFSHTIGCVNCGAIELSGSTQLSSYSGECNSEMSECNTSRVDAKLVLNPPTFRTNYGWWSVDTKCQGLMTACNEQNSCGTYSCRDSEEDEDGSATDFSFSCRVE